MTTAEVISVIALVLLGLSMLGGIAMVFMRLGKFHGETVTEITGIKEHLATLNGSVAETKRDQYKHVVDMHAEGH